MSTYIRYPSSGGSIPTYATASSLPATATDGSLAIVLDTDSLYIFDGTSQTWMLIGSGTLTVTMVGTFDSGSPSANGAHISGNAIFFQSASGTVPGMLNTSTQTIAGIKTFTGQINANSGIDRSTAGTLTIGATNSTTINIGNASATVNITGTVITEDTTVLNVTDALITVNKGGGAGSGQNAGIEIEEASSITGYMETSSNRNSWILKAPNTAGIVTITPGASGFTIDQASHNPVTLGAFGSSPNANAASLSTQVLTLQPASSSFPGGVSTSTQSFAGGKTIVGNADEVQLTVQGNGTQTSNLQNWSSSTPTVLTSINSSGNLIFTGTGSSSIPLIKMPAVDGDVGATGFYMVSGQGITARYNGTDAFWSKQNVFGFNNGCKVRLYDSGALNSITLTFGNEFGTGWYHPGTCQWAWAGAATAGGAGTQTLLLSKLASTFTGTLAVNGAADAVQFTITGNATQTSNIFKIQTSASAALLTVDNSGNGVFTGTLSASNLSGTNTGDVSLGAVGSSPNGNGASLSGQVLTLQPADGTNPGVITAGTQTIGGAKTFSGNMTLSANLTLGQSSSGVSGTNADLNAHATPIVRLTNAGLVSLASITTTGVSSGHQLWLNNQTGNAITIVNNYATPPGGSAVILTGCAADMVVQNNGTLILSYDSTSSAWLCESTCTSSMTTLGDMMYGGTSGIETRLAGNTSTTRKFLRSTGSGSAATAPVWEQPSISLTTEVTGTLPVGNGGTGQSSNWTQYGVIYASTTGVLSSTAAGTAGYVLTSNGTSAPTFQAASSTPSSSNALYNLGLSVTASGNVLTIALKQADGSTDPASGTGAVQVGMRSSTATTGSTTARTVTGALSQTLTQGTALTFPASQSGNLYIYLIDSNGSGTMKLGASSVLVDENNLQTILVESQSVTVTSASPGVVTQTAHGYVTNDAVVFTGTALPTGLSASTRYYVKVVDANSYQVAAYPNGTSINTFSTGTSVVAHYAGAKIVSDAVYSNVAVRCIGYAKVNNSTIGNWASPTLVCPLQAGMVITNNISANYYSTAGQSISASTPVVIKYENKRYDGVGIGVVGGTAQFGFIAPLAGTYLISAMITPNTHAYTAGDQTYAKININGTAFLQQMNTAYSTSGSVQSNHVNGGITCAYGDLIEVMYNSDGAVSLTSDAQKVYTSIQFIGFTP